MNNYSIIKPRTNILRFIDLESKVGDVLLDFQKNKITLSKLINSTNAIKNKAYEKSKNWDSNYSNLLLRDIFNQIWLLHDFDAGLNLLDYISALYGKKEVDYYKQDSYLGDIIVRYLPYKYYCCNYVEIVSDDYFFNLNNNLKK